MKIKKANYLALKFNILSEPSLTQKTPAMQTLQAFSFATVEKLSFNISQATPFFKCSSTTSRLFHFDISGRHLLRQGEFRDWLELWETIHSESYTLLWKWVL